MSGTGNLRRRILPIAVGAMALLDAVSLIGLAVAAQTLGKSRPLPHRTGSVRVSPPAGVTPGGRRIAPRHTPACWAARFEIHGCGFCVADDRGEWGRLAATLTRFGCPIYVLPPAESAFIPKSSLVPGNAIEEIWVSGRLMHHLRVKAVPTTLLFGPRGVLIWRKTGELSRRDGDAARRALARSQRPQGRAGPR